MDTLLNRRKAIKSRITRIENVLQEHFNQTSLLDCTGLRLYCDKLDALSREMETLQTEIISACEEAALAEQEVQYAEIMKRIEGKIIILTNLLHQSSSSQVAMQNHSSNGGNNCDIKLPRIELPTFSGKIESWLAFHDLFKATVHNAPLSNIQKFQYLKSSLKGEAALLIQSIPLTEANYIEAWNILLQRYNNEREIIDAHIKQILGQPQVASGTALELRKLIDVTNENIRALKVLNEPVDQWNSILVHIIRDKLDSETRKQWELSIENQEKPSWERLLQFLDQRARALSAAIPDAVMQTRANSGSSSLKLGQVKRPNTTLVHATFTANRCAICKAEHRTYFCDQLLSRDIEERKKCIQEHKLCLNCLKPGHKASACYAGHCRKCKEKHNTILHPSKERELINNNADVIDAHSFNSLANASPILLATALLRIKDCHGQWHTFRALLDSGSQASFVTERCVQQLRLRRRHEPVIVTGIGASTGIKPKGRVDICIGSTMDPNFQMHVEAFILTKVTKDMPSREWDIGRWSHLKDIQLADPSYYTPGHVDVLLGADVYCNLLSGGICHGPTGTPSALSTVFGWVISGQTNSGMSGSNIQVHHCDVEACMQKFWETESAPQSSPLKPICEDEKCEDIFQSTYTRDAIGRYKVSLPFTETVPDLGDSRQRALQQFLRLEHKLEASPHVKSAYAEFMQEYQQLGHMRPVNAEEKSYDHSHVYYLPHHAVTKETSMTTKLRVVFNASAKTSNGKSLNDQLLVGPKLQDDLYNLLLRFRVHKIALSADIEKMFRQIWIQDQHVNYQRIFWRSDLNHPLREYNLLTVTYGMASSSFLATRVLLQLARDEAERFPKAAEILNSDLYMDDLMTGAKSYEEASEICTELHQLAKAGGFLFRKWASNDSKLIASIPEEFKETNASHLIQEKDSVKTLGLKWHMATDTFHFTSTSWDDALPVTKRTVLSYASRIFDPLGFITPLTVRAKMIMQEIWQCKLSWDEALTGDLLVKWQNYVSEVRMLESVTVPRCIFIDSTPAVTLHGFCDAAKGAYAACVYAQSRTPDGTEVMRLVTAKSKIAPLKAITLPCLELCGAVLLSRLLANVLQAIKMDVNHVYAWTDSTVVLAWITGSSRKLKAFVSNRVQLIRELVPGVTWRYVPGGQNPADCASRGISVSQLIQHKLWWSGPDIKDLQEQSLSPADRECHQEGEQEEQQSLMSSIHQDCSDALLHRYSSLTKLQRVTAYVLRFLHNVKVKKGERVFGPLTPEELRKALYHWVRVVQRQAFTNDINALEQGKDLPMNSKLSTLAPYMDSTGILRVGGRLNRAKLPMDQRNPILLPHKSILTDLIINFEHRKTLHGGNQLVKAEIQKRFWIVGARNRIRDLIHRCVICARQRPRNLQQIMADLPEARVNPGRPFQICGVDYAGPFSTRDMRPRSKLVSKSYLAIFVCFTTKAVHLELVSGLTTEAFIAALKRFISRRGKCSQIYSDCGTNFVGADRELRKYKQKLQTAHPDNAVATWLANEGIDWKFNPPASPHFGGLWEAGVRATKYHLKRVVGDTKLTFEELQTVLCQIEACLNSRPLTALSNNPNDFGCLTPGHFLTGDSIMAIPEPNLTDIENNRLSRWQLVQKMTQHFWKRWKNEYLVQLQQRPKWRTQRDNIQVDRLVLLKEDLPPTRWKLARVVQVHPGDDGNVRVVTVRTADSKEIIRPIVKICPLPMDM